MSGRKDFISQRAPENYVAGLGRGATGFTTRSDLGSHRAGPDEEQMKEMLAKRAAQLGAAPPTAYGATDKKEKGKDDDEGGDAEQFQDPDNETGLFASGMYDREDDEADRIYQEVDEKMEKRRKARREEREKREREEYERNNPKVSEQFADLKRSLATVTDDEWAAIPEVGDLTRKNKRQKQNQQKRFYAVPDSVIAGAAGSTQFETSVQEEGDTGDGADGTMTNFADIGAARDKVLQVRLDQAASAGSASSNGSSGTSTSIDAKGYMTSLEKNLLANDKPEVGDVKRVRVLLESVIKTNPKHAPGWIAAARLEELAGKVVAARSVIARGCEICPKSEDLWLENIRLNGENKHNARVIAANAIKQNDRSTRLWIEAMRLEENLASKKRVIRKAIDHIPQSVNIWKEAVNLEESVDDAKLMLGKATEVIPQSEDLWLALARLETAENAQKVLNAARKRIPTSYQIWLAAVRLIEQTSGDADRVDQVMNRTVKALAKESAMLKREEWIEQAEKCEEEGAILTCGAIVRQTLGYGMDEDDDRLAAWLDDALTCVRRERYETARAMYAYTLRVFPTARNAWEAAAELEKEHGSKAALEQVLEKAVEACPHSSDLWMQLAKEKWQAGDLDGARRVLGRAFTQNENNEDIWLAAVKLEADNNETQQARELLATARVNAGTDRVWIKSVAFERNVGRDDDALDMANEGLQQHPKADKLWMQKGQIYQAQGKIPQARETYSTGTRACPKSVALWLLFSRLEEQTGAIVKARSVLDRARLAVPKNEYLWTESVRVELRAGNTGQAKTVMAKALQEVPTSGLLWTENIMHLVERPQRRARLLEAIKKNDRSPQLFVTAARVFWAARALDKAATWFEKALVLDPDEGDSWAWYYKFLREHGTDEKKAEVRQKIASVEPKHGETWAPVAKDPALLCKGEIKGPLDVLEKVVERLPA